MEWISRPNGSGDGVCVIFYPRAQSMTGCRPRFHRRAIFGGRPACARNKGPGEQAVTCALRLAPRTGCPNCPTFSRRIAEAHYSTCALQHQAHFAPSICQHALPKCPQPCPPPQDPPTAPPSPPSPPLPPKRSIPCTTPGAAPSQSFSGA